MVSPSIIVSGGLFEERPFFIRNNMMHFNWNHLKYHQWQTTLYIKVKKKICQNDWL